MNQSQCGYQTYARTIIACIAGLVLGTHSPAWASQELIELSQDESQWVMTPKNYANTRFSGLDQINKENVKDLEAAWSFSTGIPAGHEAAPLVVKGTMYVVTPFPNTLLALDPMDGTLKWSYKPPVSSAAQGVACCDVVNRGPAYAEGKIFFNTLDNQTVAVDAQSGEEVWRIRLGDIDKGETMTMAPLVVKDKVLVGNSGGEMGVRGWITALDVANGEIVWRAFSTGPDEDVLIDHSYFEPPYDDAAGDDLGVTTWPPGAWEIGGGTVWGWISYDPDLDLIYHGTANPGPWNHTQRPGDNKWTATLFARNPDTGLAKWAYQWTPHDHFDYDGINENILLNLEIDGETREVLVHPGRSGFMYVMDRATGQVLSAEPFDHVNTIKRIDLDTGRPIYNEAKIPKEGEVMHEVCPPAPGAKDWQPSAFSPRTQLLYVPHQHLCQDMKLGETGYISGTPYVGAEVAMYAGPGGHRGEFMAWDPVKQKKVWAIREDFPVWSGTVVTAGDVAFYGTMDRWFKAVDVHTGELLWEFRTASGIIGQPVTYLGANGVQYVAILAGVGGWAGAVVSGDLDTDVPYGALGFVGAMQDLPDVTQAGSTLHVFALPAKGNSAAKDVSEESPAPSQSNPSVEENE